MRFSSSTPRQLPVSPPWSFIRLGFRYACDTHQPSFRQKKIKYNSKPGSEAPSLRLGERRVSFFCFFGRRLQMPRVKRTGRATSRNPTEPTTKIQGAEWPGAESREHTPNLPPAFGASVSAARHHLTGLDRPLFLLRNGHTLNWS